MTLKLTVNYVNKNISRLGIDESKYKMSFITKELTQVTRILNLRNRVIHQLLDDTAGHVLHDVLVDGAGDDGNSDDVSTLVDDLTNLLVFDPHHILTIDLQQVVIYQESIPGCRGVHCDGSNSSFFELKSDVSRGVLTMKMNHSDDISQCKIYLVKSQSSLEGSVSDHHVDVVD